ncbi:DUF3413 domain-containing protein [Cobetia amphilecti]|uniref:DUF3413 domain-containing protein n=1 Tax=Cobetia amphilecti TaxID=1055104 RepID=UPI001C0933FF|nr:DUF3413 domain-containing protein [Cobetia amphilecti]MBU3008877.1 DUF3413 domain-containing protein [Cobetia amphilecti]
MTAKTPDSPAPANARPRDSRRRYLRDSATFSLAILVLIWLVATRYLPFTPFPQGVSAASLSGWAYLATTWLGHYGLLAQLLWLPLGLLGMILPARSARRWLWLPAGILAGSALSALIIDSLVYAQYRFHLNGFMLSMFLNDSNGEIFEFDATTWLLGACTLLGLIALCCGLAYRLSGPAAIKRAHRLPTGKLHALLFLMLLASHIQHIVSDAHHNLQVTREAPAFPLLFPATARDFMEDHGWLDARTAEAAKVHIQNFGAGSLAYPAVPLKQDNDVITSRGVDGQPANILFLVIDSWRADSFTAETMPHLHAALADGLHFPDHISGGNSTRTGFFSLLSGLTANYVTPMENDGLGSVLVNQALQRQWPLGLFSSASFNGVGLDRSLFPKVPDLRLRTLGDSPAMRDRVMTTDWLAWQAQRRQTALQQDAHALKPWLGVLFYDAPHGYSLPRGASTPFQPSATGMDYLTLGPDTDPTPVRNLYLNSLYHLDRQLARVIQDLKEHGEWDNTVLVVTGDHAQEFNDSGKNFWGHNGNFTRYQTQVPLILRGPGIPAGHYGSQLPLLPVTAHYDVVPTLLRHVMGISNPPSDYSMGHDLLRTLDHQPEVDNEWVLSGSYQDFGIIQRDRIYALEGTGGYAVYDGDMNRRQALGEGANPVMKVMETMRRFYAN